MIRTSGWSSTPSSSGSSHQVSLTIGKAYKTLKICSLPFWSYFPLLFSSATQLSHPAHSHLRAFALAVPSAWNFLRLLFYCLQVCVQYSSSGKPSLATLCITTAPHAPLLVLPKGPALFFSIVLLPLRYATFFTSTSFYLESPLSKLPVAQLVKNPPAMQETLVWFLGWEIPWRRKG